MPRPPHKLDLYRLSVQNPQAEVMFLLRAYARHARRGGRPRRQPTRLREDFGGTAAAAMVWVAMHENHRALAVDRDPAVLAWVRRTAAGELGRRAADLHLVRGDVCRVAPPRVPPVDILTATNFSMGYLHSRPALLDYLANVRRGLRAGGIFVMDLYGGAGAQRLGTWQRRIRPDQGTGIAAFGYQWQQKSFNAVTARTDCRIHFDLADGTRLRNAFRYDWRLWTLPEVVEAMRDAGLRRPEVWCDRLASEAAGRSPAAGQDGRFRPVTSFPAREDWVAYVVAGR